MNMSFDRYRAQTFCESSLGCNNFNDFYDLNRTVIETYALNYNEASTLRAYLYDDAKDLYFKGCQSLTESLVNFRERHYSWAVIKSYYAVFYMLKADLALRGYALIRHRAIYYLHALDGNCPQTKGSAGANRKRYKGDHKATINYYIDFFLNSDILLSQEIDSMNVYEWLMKKREQINYQERSFKEPDRPDFLSYINSRIISGGFTALIDEIKSDNNYILTFQPEYAPIAIPYKRALLTKQNFINIGIGDILTTAQNEHLDRFGENIFK